MISAEQLRQIAALPDSADFRFERRFGETVVNVVYPSGGQFPFSIHEDGSHLVVTPSGQSYGRNWGQREFSTKEDAIVSVLDTI